MICHTGEANACKRGSRRAVRLGADIQSMGRQSGAPDYGSVNRPAGKCRAMIAVEPTVTSDQGFSARSDAMPTR